jgi:cyclopropane-fatty-acyl-phospholipid synthase
MFDRHITNRFLSALSHTTHGTLHVTTPDGRVRSFGGAQAGATATLTIHDWRMVGAILRGGDVALS